MKKIFQYLLRKLSTVMRGTTSKTKSSPDSSVVISIAPRLSKAPSLYPKITIDDLNTRGANLGDQEKKNLEKLADKINLFQSRFGKKVHPTNGFRSKEHHIEVYSKINARRATEGLPARSIPWGSQHLQGNAVDLLDKNGDLHAFVLSPAGLQCLEELDLYCEDPRFTPGWLHCQTVPPKSGKRFFKP